MIQHVYEKCKQTINELVVATDDQRIVEAVESFGGNVILTNNKHKTGTNRCLEALENWSNQKNKEFKYIINIQGDEPLISNDHLTQLINCFNDKSATIATLALEIKPSDNIEEGKVYLTKNKDDFALYFSRFPIPFLRDIPKEKWTQINTYYQHIGIYGYTKEALMKFCSMKESNLEKNEKLEQLRWLEAGERIKVGCTNIPSYPVDTDEDLKKVRKLYDLNNIN
jgi:3-deoxy-manno-octulosonate cytidylyltransferase (CMP-KDO synthetase)